MGKYTTVGGKSSIKDAPWQQTHAMIFIANEIAESNRLKRIELREKYAVASSSGTGYYLDNHDADIEELEDQA